MTGEWQAPPVLDRLRALLIAFARNHGIEVDHMFSNGLAEGFVIDKFIGEVVAAAAVKRTVEVRYFGPMLELMRALGKDQEAAPEILSIMRHTFLWRGAEFQICNLEDPERWELRVASNVEAVEPTRLDNAIIDFMVSTFSNLGHPITPKTAKEMVARAVATWHDGLPVATDPASDTWAAWEFLYRSGELAAAAIRDALATYALGPVVLTVGIRTH